MFIAKGKIFPSYQEKPRASNTLIVHTNFHLELTGIEIFCMVQITPYVFAVNGFKMSIHYPEILLHSHWAWGESRPHHTALHCRAQFLYNTPRKAANPQSHSLVFRRTPPFTAYSRAIVQNPGQGERYFTWLILLPHQTQGGQQQEAVDLHSHILVENCCSLGNPFDFM